MALGMPVAISLGLSSILTILFFANDSLASLSIKLYETSEHYTLLSIPFFILAGTMMSTGGVAKRMVRFAVATVGHLRGGLAIASVLACTLFAAVSGSSPATVVAIGSIVIAGMVKSGYPKAFAAGVICNAGTLGILIPPSIVMVVYATVTEISVGRMFMAGVIPGLLLASMLALAVWWRAGKLTRTERASPRELLIAFKDSPGDWRCWASSWAASTVASSRPPKQQPLLQCMPRSWLFSSIATSVCGNCPRS